MSWITVNGKRQHVQTEACQPYNRFGNWPPPVHVWEILDRLDQDQLKKLAMGYSVHAPVFFENQLLEIA